MRERKSEITETFPGRRGMTALALRIEQEAREIFPRVVSREPAKIIAFKAGATPRSAENWQNGAHLPQIHHFIALACQFPELKAKVLGWLGEKGDEGSRDDPEKVLHEIQTLLMQRMK